MKKADLIAQLEGAKALTSVVSIDNVIALIQGLEEVRVETQLGMSQELAEAVADKIERALDYNSSDLVDMDSAEFELNYDNRIELTRVDISVREIMTHVSAALDEFVIEEDEEDEINEADSFIEAQIEAEQAASINQGLGLEPGGNPYAE
jgi:hypothetical protein